MLAEGKTAMAHEIQTLIGKGTKYTGKLTFDDVARIYGAFEGEVFSGGILVVGPEADIRAEVQVRICILLGGRVRGTLRASELVELYTGAVLEADLQTPQLFIERGARFDGHCAMQPTDASRPVQAVAKLRSPPGIKVTEF